MKKFRVGAQIIVFLLLPVWATWIIVQTAPHIEFRGFIDSTVTVDEVTLMVHGLMVILWLLVVVELVREVRHWGSWVAAQSHWHLGSKHLVMSALALTPTSSPPVSQVASLPAESMVTPILATKVLADVLQRRREQIQRRVIPRRLTEAEQHQMQKLMSATDQTREISKSIDYVSTSDVVELLHAVEETEDVLNQGLDVIEQWRVVVRIYGHPQVESDLGSIAIFRKKRALELISWLSVNRDRSRRSAARTALWDVDVTDGSFSTIVSDMRRSLAELVPSVSREQLVPTTYTDDIHLDSSITSDFEIICRALSKFRKDPTSAPELAHALQLIRDVPFAGTSYSWADYDGTTTRLIVTAVDAAVALAQWGLNNNRIDLSQIALKAGLRVMPSCEELLELNKRLLLHTQTSRTPVSH